MPRALSQRLLGPGYGQDRVTFSLAPGTLARKLHAVVDAYVVDRRGLQTLAGPSWMKKLGTTTGLKKLSHDVITV
jgi:hypothetical protein